MSNQSHGCPCLEKVGTEPSGLILLAPPVTHQGSRCPFVRRKFKRKADGASEDLVSYLGCFPLLTAQCHIQSQESDAGVSWVLLPLSHIQISLLICFHICSENLESSIAFAEGGFGESCLLISTLFKV